MTELPKGWATAKFSDFGEWMGGGTPSKEVPSYWNGPIPWVSPKDMKTNVIRSAIDGITEAAVENSAAKRVPAGSVLIVARSGILAHTLPIAVTAVETTLNQDMKALTLSGVLLSPTQSHSMLYIMLKQSLNPSSFVCMHACCSGVIFSSGMAGAP